MGLDPVGKGGQQIGHRIAVVLRVGRTQPSGIDCLQIGIVQQRQDRVQRVDALLPKGRIFTGKGAHLWPVAMVQVADKERFAVTRFANQLLELALQRVILILIADHHHPLLLAGQGSQRLCLGIVVGERFFDPDIFAR